MPKFHDLEEKNGKTWVIGYFIGPMVFKVSKGISCRNMVIMVLLTIVAMRCFQVSTFNFSTSKESTTRTATEGWSKVTKDIYVLSAYWESRDLPLTPYVRFIAVSLLLQEPERPCNCVLVYEDDSIVTVPFEKEVIIDHHNRKSTAVFFKCGSVKGTRPNYARIHCSQHSKSDWKKVRLLNNDSPKGNLALCVRPFFGTLPDPLRLAEFISYYDLMGVSHFTFYDLQASKPLKKFIHELMEKKQVSIEFLPWEFPRNLETWEFGQQAFTQECIYKHMSDFEYVTLLDPDEYFVLNGSLSLISFLKSLDPKIGALTFKHVFFCRNSSEPSNPHELITQKWVLRAPKVMERTYRTKYSVRTGAVIIGSIHFPDRLVRGYKETVLEPRDGILHHYRAQYCRMQELIEDKSALKYGDQLREHAVLKLWNKTFKG